MACQVEDKEFSLPFTWKQLSKEDQNRGELLKQKILHFFDKVLSEKKNTFTYWIIVIINMCWTVRKVDIESKKVFQKLLVNKK